MLHEKPMIPTLATHGWELESAVDRNRTYPTFEIPAEYERTHRQIGDRVKLRFLLVGADAQGAFVQGERMWVRIESMSETTYTGILDSEPATAPVLHPGDQIVFQPDHIAAMYVPQTDAQHPAYQPDQ